jgi:hypothetical protein
LFLFLLTKLDEQKAKKVKAPRDNPIGRSICRWQEARQVPSEDNYGCQTGRGDTAKEASTFARKTRERPDHVGALSGRD